MTTMKEIEEQDARYGKDPADLLPFRRSLHIKKGEVIMDPASRENYAFHSPVSKGDKKEPQIGI